MNFLIKLCFLWFSCNNFLYLKPNDEYSYSSSPSTPLLNPGRYQNICNICTYWLCLANESTTWFENIVHLICIVLQSQVTRFLPLMVWPDLEEKNKKGGGWRIWRRRKWFWWQRQTKLKEKQMVVVSPNLRKRKVTGKSNFQWTYTVSGKKHVELWMPDYVRRLRDVQNTFFAMSSYCV